MYEHIGNLGVAASYETQNARLEKHMLLYVERHSCVTCVSIFMLAKHSLRWARGAFVSWYVGVEHVFPSFANGISGQDSGRK